LRLRSEGFDVWRDKRNIKTDWSVEIGEAPTDRDHAVGLAWSDASHQRFER